VTLGYGKVAGLADGAVVGKDGDSVVLATIVSDRSSSEVEGGDDGTPFSVEYREKAASSGRIPKTPNRREPPNNENEILTGRAVDRCLRPLFPPMYHSDTQLTATVQAFDRRQPEPPVSLVANASSAAIHISDIPWNGPIGCVRVARVKGRFISEPTKEELAASDLDLIYAGTADRTVMIEMSAHQLSNKEIKKAFRFAHEQVSPIIDAQIALRDNNEPLLKRPESPYDDTITEQGAPDFSAHQRTQSWNPLNSLFSSNKSVEKPKQSTQASGSLLEQAVSLAARLDNGEARAIFEDHTASRGDRAYREAMFTERVSTEMSTAEPDWPKSLVSHAVHERLWIGMRSALLDACKQNKPSPRCDGRSATELREISSDMNVMPSVHGSSLFSRGNTQVLCTATLGAAIDSIDPSARSALGGPVVQGKTSEHLTTLDPSKADDSDLRRLMLHYEFPAYCTGEIKQGGGPNRRAMGHGALAQKSLDAVMPPAWRFPYVVRLACEVLSSNGSSSMASVCAGTMAMLDAGVPLLAPVAGVSVGLISREDTSGELEHVLLADILGLEDHYGDMDFKVSGSRHGVTAIQLDVKLAGGVPLSILEDGLEVALTARCSILDTMEAELEAHLPESQRSTAKREAFENFMQRGLALKSHAPRLRVITFARDRLQFLLGPGGETKRTIEREHDCILDLGDDAHELASSGNSTGCVVHVFAPDKASCDNATRMVQELVCDVEHGAILSAVVSEVKDFGAFLEVLRGRTGLLHVSEISNTVSGMNAVDLLKVGDVLDVMCIGSDPLSGAVKLSRKRILDQNDRLKRDTFSKTGMQAGTPRSRTASKITK